MNEFVIRYKEAETTKEKILCWFARLTHGNVVTPLGRIVLLPQDYKIKELEFMTWS